MNLVSGNPADLADPALGTNKEGKTVSIFVPDEQAPAAARADHNVSRKPGARGARDAAGNMLIVKLGKHPTDEQRAVQLDTCVTRPTRARLR